MKLLTLNTHSLMEKSYESKLNTLVNAIIKHKIDVVALQEIMQPIDEAASKYSHTNCGNIPLKCGNHALNVVKALDEKGKKYNLVWVGFKRSYDAFDEGLAILTPYSVEETKVITLTPFDDYHNWKTRKALGVKINDNWFYSVHMGWWDSFEQELASLLKGIEKDKRIWLMGDFNSIASERGKGYDLMISSGLYDTYTLAVNKDSGITAHVGIDGWEGEDREIRIDYIFANKQAEIESSLVIFNGANEDIVSDHFGILLTTGRNYL